MSDNFELITGSFKKRGLKFDYISEAGLRDSRYYIRNSIKSNTREPICLTWTWTGITCDNTSPMIFEVCKEMQVKYPFHCRTATIFFGANLKDPVDGIECWIDEDNFNSASTNYKTKVCFLNEVGKAMNLTVTSSYFSQLKSSVLEVEVGGDASILCEKTKNLILQDSTQLQGWKIASLDSLNELFGESKNFTQFLEYLQPRNSQKTYLYCRKPTSNSSGKIVFTSTGENTNFEDALFCIFFETTKQKIAFSAKAFIPK
jgi:hypothetical protein